MIGLNGDLRDQWKTIPEAYMGIAVENMPNYFSQSAPVS